MIQIEGGNFQDAEGNPIANGYLVFQISADCQITTDNGQLASNAPVTVLLDSTGNVPTSPVIELWSNQEITNPSGTYYTVTLFYGGGGAVWQTPQIWVLPDVSPLNIGTMTPTAPGGPSYPTFISGTLFASSTVTFSATPTFTPTALFQLFKMTLTGNVTSSTFAAGVAVAGSLIFFELTQDGTGGRTFAWPSNSIGGAVIGSSPGQTTSQAFYYDGTNLVPIGPGVANP